MAAAALLRNLGLEEGAIYCLGNLEVEDDDEIGRGSDAIVYKKAWNGIDIGIKVLHSLLVQPGDEGRETKLRQFGGEISKLSTLHHPNLCQFIGVALVRRLPALALELLDRTLETCSVGVDREDDPTLLSYLSDMAAGLRYLHTRGIIHRDLAPKNVLVKNGIAKLCDFGVAKAVRRQSPFQRMADAAASTACPGTLLFMPPEALRDPAVYGEPLDIFSSGVVVVSVLTGLLPSVNLLYSDRTRIVVSADGSRRQEAIPEQERRRTDLNLIPDGHPLKPLAVRCLSNEPASRPTAVKMHEAIRRVAQQAANLTTHWNLTPEPLSGAKLYSDGHNASMEARYLFCDAGDYSVTIAHVYRSYDADKPHRHNFQQMMLRRVNEVLQGQEAQAVSVAELSANQRTLRTHLEETAQRVTSISEHIAEIDHRSLAVEQAVVGLDHRLVASVASSSGKMSSIAEQVSTANHRGIAVERTVVDIDSLLTSSTVSSTEKMVSIAEQVCSTEQRSLAMKQSVGDLDDRVKASLASSNEQFATIAKEISGIKQRSALTEKLIDDRLTTVTTGINSSNEQLSTIVETTSSIAELVTTLDRRSLATERAVVDLERRIEARATSRDQTPSKAEQIPAAGYRLRPSTSISSLYSMSSIAEQADPADHHTHSFAMELQSGDELLLDRGKVRFASSSSSEPIEPAIPHATAGENQGLPTDTSRTAGHHLDEQLPITDQPVSATDPLATAESSQHTQPVSPNKEKSIEETAQPARQRPSLLRRVFGSAPPKIAASVVAPEATPFPADISSRQWQPAAGPCTQTLCGRVHNTVHNDLFYAFFNTKVPSMEAYTTSDFASWTPVPVPEDVIRCHSICTNRNSLLMYARKKNGADVIFRVNCEEVVGISSRNPIRQTSPGMFATDTDVYICGGRTSEVFLTLCSHFSLATAEWSHSKCRNSRRILPNPLLPELPTPVSSPCIVTIDKDVLFVGGYYADRSVSAAPIMKLILDQPSNKLRWQTQADQTNVCVSATSCGDYVIVAGGNDRAAAQNSAACYAVHHRTGDVIQLPALLIPCQFPNVCHYKGNLVCIGYTINSMTYHNDVSILRLH